MDNSKHKRFLEELATQYGFYGDTWTAFLGRFACENADKPNNQLRLTWTKDDLVNKEQKIQDELKKIYPALRENGCDIPDTNRGRYPKGKSPWELVYKWLWEVKFPVWEDSSGDKDLSWESICELMLKKYLDLTSNDHLPGGGIKPGIDRVYVPLALVERRVVKESQRPGEQGKEEEKLVQISEDSFKEALRQGRGESQGRRIAIIGEPGSGKTTRLQKLAVWILEEGLGLPIWISLAGLEQRKITQYLREAWLPENLSLEALQAEKHRIWLLLDGVDEMTARIEKGHVSQLLDDWTEEVRVVVTCRLNVWEADKNAFSGFEVFRNLPFEPEQVELFIRKWFEVL
ncbi:MAG: NACHT domain-containing protein [Coleofasciculaceae cyanobacterium SM2_1_6]|nr:NACHT domain-containing protein [Coleofasciculaceae cyanobacterium SM2_1_6]